MPISGANATESSSWKLDTSQMTVASGSTSPTSVEAGVPTLPATATGTPRGAIDRPEQLDRRRLAVGAGHRDELVRQQPPAELELAEDRDARARARRR